METERKNNKREMTNNRTDSAAFCCIRTFICFIAGFFAVLPIFVSLTIRPWYIHRYGMEFINTLMYTSVGRYWSFFVYLLGGLMVMAMLAGIFSKYRIRDLRGKLDRTWYISHWLPIHMLALLSWSILSTCFAKDKQAALWGDHFCKEGLILYFCYGALFLCGSWLKRSQMKGIIELLTAVCAFTGILIILRDPRVFRVFYTENHLSAMFHQYNHYGYFLSICTPLVIGLVLQDQGRNWLWRGLRLGELWLIFNALVSNNVRGSFLAVLAVVAFWNLYVFVCKKELKGRMLFVDVLFFATLFFLNTHSVLMERFWELIQNFADVFKTSGNRQGAVDEIGTGRGELWRYGIRFAMEKPVFGYGPANLLEPYRLADSHTSSPHNDLILIAASMGFPALYFYISGLCGHFMIFSRQVKKYTVLETAVFFAAAAYLLGSLMGVSMYYTACYYFLLLGFTYGICRDKGRE